jgi:hypothetical protein
MRDTTPAARQLQLKVIRAMPPAERLRQALLASELSRTLLLDGMRRRYPGESDLELVERVLGRTLVPPSARPAR